jgi:hypothetical protein
MKLVTFIHLIVLVCTLPVIAATPDQPAEVQAAINYIQKLAHGQVDLTRDTALSKHCSISRRKEIKDQLDFLKKTQFHDSDTFSLIEMKINIIEKKFDVILFFNVEEVYKCHGSSLGFIVVIIAKRVSFKA